MDEEFEVLRRQLARCRGGSSGRGTRYPRRLRTKVAQVAREALAGGSPLSETSRRLGVAAGSVERWLAEEPLRAFRPVEVAATASRRWGLTLVSPSGYRIEGLEPAEVEELLARLDAR